MTDRALTADQASAVYDALVTHAGASEDGRGNFIAVQIDGRCDEYRFMGGLGFGGKFWNTSRRWYVSAYPEDVSRRPDMQDIIHVTNAALATLRAGYTARGALT